MEKIRFACSISDIEYKKRFLERILSSGYFTMDAREEYFEMAFVDDDGDMEGVDKIVILCKDHVKPEYKDNILKIYRFTGFQELIRLIFFHFGYVGSSEVEGVLEGVKIISVISTSGGIGASSIARSLSKTMYMTGYKPLYLDLSPFGLNRVGHEDQMGSGMLKFLYAIRRDRIKDISMFVVRDGDIETLSGDTVNHFSKNYDAETIDLLSKAAYSTGYDLLVIDIGNHLDKENLSIVRKSDIVIEVLSSKDNWTDKKIERVDEMFGLEKGCSLHILNQTEELSGKDELNKRDGQELELIDVKIPYLNESIMKDKVGAFANEIKFLADIVGGRLAEE